MTDQQLYLAVGLPVITVLAGMLLNSHQFTGLNGRMQSLESRMTALGTKFDLLVGKVVDVANRLTRVDEQLKHRR